VIDTERPSSPRGRFPGGFRFPSFPLRSLLPIFALLLAAGGFLAFLGAAGVLDLGFMAANIDLMYAPALLTLGITAASFLLGVWIGLPIGFLRAFYPTVKKSRSSGHHRRASAVMAVSTPLYAFGTGYMEAIRGTPFLVQMWLVYFFVLTAFAQVPRVEILAGILALTINTGAYQSEIFRAGFQAVGQGQVEAGQAIGLGPGGRFRFVLLPQALRISMLPLTNEFIGVLKASSILSVISVFELTFMTRHIGANLGHPLEAFVMVSLFYLAIIIPISRIVARVERTRRIPGLGVPDRTGAPAA